MNKPARCAALIDRIGCFYAVMGAVVVGLARVHDDARIGRKIFLYASGWMTWWASKWSFDYAMILLGKDAATIAAGGVVVVGVVGPVLGLTGWVFKTIILDGADERRMDAATPTTEATQTSTVKTTGVTP